MRSISLIYLREECRAVSVEEPLPTIWSLSNICGLLNGPNSMALTSSNTCAAVLKPGIGIVRSLVPTANQALLEPSYALRRQSVFFWLRLPFTASIPVLSRAIFSMCCMTVQWSLCAKTPAPSGLSVLQPYQRIFPSATSFSKASRTTSRK